MSAVTLIRENACGNETRIRVEYEAELPPDGLPFCGFDGITLIPPKGVVLTEDEKHFLILEATENERCLVREAP
jgi:hypothetical protein